MYNKLKHIEGVNLLPKEVVGPALVGSVEYFNGEKNTYHGSLVATTHRLFMNLEDHDLVCIEEISFDTFFIFGRMTSCSSASRVFQKESSISFWNFSTNIKHSIQQKKKHLLKGKAGIPRLFLCV